jgi:hypothetical protein
LQESWPPTTPCTSRRSRLTSTPSRTNGTTNNISKLDRNSQLSASLQSDQSKLLLELQTVATSN